MLPGQIEPNRSRKSYKSGTFLGGYTVNDQPHPRGEIVISGHNVTKGYLHQDEKTREVYKTDSDGKVWFHTGDIGEVMPDGVFKVIGKLLLSHSCFEKALMPFLKSKS